MWHRHNGSQMTCCCQTAISMAVWWHHIALSPVKSAD